MYYLEMIIRDVLRNFDFEMRRDVDIFVRKKTLARTNIKLGFGPTDNWIYDPTIETWFKNKVYHSTLPFEYDFATSSNFSYW